MDILSYAHTLPEKEKAWLNSFVEEYVNANMQHRGKKLHTTKATRKICFDKNNARNACIYSGAKAAGKTLDWDNYRGYELEYEMEDYLIDKIDDEVEQVEKKPYLGSSEDDE